MEFGVDAARSSGTKIITLNTEVSGAGKVEEKFIKASEGLCILTEVRGRFDGGGEAFNITRKDGFWHLEVNAGCKDRKAFSDLCDVHKTVKARVTCFAYDQS